MSQSEDFHSLPMFMWRSHAEEHFRPVVLQSGIIRMHLLSGAWMDVAPSRAVKIHTGSSMLANIACNGSSFAVNHPNASVIHDGNTKIVSYNSGGTIAFANCYRDSVSLSSIGPYVHRIWNDGLYERRDEDVSEEDYIQLDKDYALDLFHRNFVHCDEEWLINDVQAIIYALESDGLVCSLRGFDIVHHWNGHFKLHSPQDRISVEVVHSLGKVSVTTPAVKFSVQKPSGSWNILSLRNDHRQLYSDEEAMYVLNENYCAYLGNSSCFTYVSK